MNTTNMKKDHHKYERTIVILKPDAVQRTLVSEIIGRFERVGLKIVGLKMCVVDKAFAEKHYTLDSSWKHAVGSKLIDNMNGKGTPLPETDPLKVGETILKRLTTYLSCGPVIPIVLQGAHAVKLVRKLVGSTEPLTSAPGTIRGDYVLDSYEMTETDDRGIRNLIHASGSIKEAEGEIKLWFKDEELLDYNLAQDAILYDVNLDGILE